MKYWKRCEFAKLSIFFLFSLQFDWFFQTVFLKSIIIIALIPLSLDESFGVNFGPTLVACAETNTCRIQVFFRNIIVQ